MKKTYQELKQEAREKAQQWQLDESPKSWGQIAEETTNFKHLAKRYGLIEEFKREGII